MTDEITMPSELFVVVLTFAGIGVVCTASVALDWAVARLRWRPVRKPIDLQARRRGVRR